MGGEDGRKEGREVEFVLFSIILFSLSDFKQNWVNLIYISSWSIYIIYMANLIYISSWSTYIIYMANLIYCNILKKTQTCLGRKFSADIVFVKRKMAEESNPPLQPPSPDRQPRGCRPALSFYLSQRTNNATEWDAIKKGRERRNKDKDSRLLHVNQGAT